MGVGLLQTVGPQSVHRKWWTVRALAFVLLAALPPAYSASAASDGAALGTGDQARIVNGTVTSAYAAVGALLVGSSPGTASMVCSGTLIGCKTFVTAAHCVCDGTGASCQAPNEPSPNGFLVFLPHAGFIPVAHIHVHPDYQFLSRFSRADIATIELSVSVSGVPAMGIADAAAPIGTAGTIVGFGRSGGNSRNTDYAIKRVGSVTTETCNTPNDDGLVCWNFFGSGSNTCNGDSGGPLFADFGGGEVLSGLTSGGASATCLPNDHSFDTDVGYFSAWVESAATEALGPMTCGSGSQVGGAANLAEGVSGSLAGCRLTALHEFLISAGSSQVRISMNAKDDGETDFDLLVKHGAPPTSAGDADCVQSGSGQFGFCQFANPAGGRWFARINRRAGNGEYQVTLNDRDTQPSSCGNALREPGEDCDGADDDLCEGLCEPGCTCPTPSCGNGVTESGEDCDGGSDAACPGSCELTCSCACRAGDVTIGRVSATAKRLLLKALVDTSSGKYGSFNPSEHFSLTLSDGVTTIPIELPPGDLGWEYSNCLKRHFKWKGDHDGIQLISVIDKTASRGVVSIKLRGGEVAGADTLLPESLGVEVHLDGTCATGSLP